MGLHATEDLGAVHLAQHHLGDAHAQRCVHHAPAVAVEHRQRMQVHVAIVHPGMPTERGGVQPQRPVRLFHPLGPGGRARGVVDRGGGVLVGLPRLRFAVGQEPFGIALGAQHHLVGDLHPGDRVGHLRVVQQDRGAAMLDDVGHLDGAQAEVDRHVDAPPPGHPEEAAGQAGGVVRDDRHPFADPDAEGVEVGGLVAGPASELRSGDRSPRLGRLVRFVDDGDAVGKNQLGPVEKIDDAQVNLHVHAPLRPRGPPPGGCHGNATGAPTAARRHLTPRQIRRVG